jgi:hypothetical protein
LEAFMAHRKTGLLTILGERGIDEYEERPSEEREPVYDLPEPESGPPVSEPFSDDDDPPPLRT